MFQSSIPRILSRLSRLKILASTQPSVQSPNAASQINKHHLLPPYSRTAMSARPRAKDTGRVWTWRILALAKRC
jgi:hypothetical protein